MDSAVSIASELMSIDPDQMPDVRSIIYGSDDALYLTVFGTDARWNETAGVVRVSESGRATWFAGAAHSVNGTLLVCPVDIVQGGDRAFYVINDCQNADRRTAEYLVNGDELHTLVGAGAAASASAMATNTSASVASTSDGRGDDSLISKNTIGRNRNLNQLVKHHRRQKIDLERVDHYQTESRLLSD